MQRSHSKSYGGLSAWIEENKGGLRKLNVCHTGSVRTCASGPFLLSCLLCVGMNKSQGRQVDESNPCWIVPDACHDGYE
jgi:hypothetical protein